MKLEVHLPLRNVTEVFERSVESLAGQTWKGFGVVLSDNFSTSGAELIAQGEARLREAGVAVRVVRPPRELARVEHWNWVHAQGEAAWIKPLFAGDALEPNCLERVRECVEQFPAARFLHFGYEYQRGDEAAVRFVYPGELRYRGPAEMSDAVLRTGHQFGPPSTYAFERAAFLAAGGYTPMLPICADNLLCCTLATRHGVVSVPEVLGHFHIHGARFSTNLAGRRRAILSETVTYFLRLVYHAWTENRAIPRIAALRMLARSWREYARAE